MENPKFTWQLSRRCLPSSPCSLIHPAVYPVRLRGSRPPQVIDIYGKWRELWIDIVSLLE